MNLAVGKSAVARRHIAIVALHNLVKGKKFYLGMMCLLLASTSVLSALDLLPEFGVNSEGLHLVAYLLDKALGRIRNRCQFRAIL